ncbi:molybdopterin-guanine dinucleotide biosynthesis protein B [Paenibacillus caui]|uniref:molybdopterin-guanine dinucleotide biosynthesis protein B n=1 Tax=Paenibacillus caui TaxID=2873927 RepID=UPI001CA9AD6B
MPYIVQIVGYKNSGKTTLAEYLVRYFTRKGIRVAVIKHDGHQFEADRPGTDTWRMSQAGATAVAITSAKRTAVIEERGTPLQDLVHRFSSHDLIIVEGFKQEAYPKIVMLRNDDDAALLRETANIRVVVCWEDAAADLKKAAGEGYPAAGEPLCLFRLNDRLLIAEWLEREAGLQDAAP